MAGLIKCMVCGYEFKPEYSEEVCSKCPLLKFKGDCGFAKCPNCGYDNIIMRERKSKLKNLLKKIFK